MAEVWAAALTAVAGVAAAGTAVYSATKSPSGGGAGSVAQAGKFRPLDLPKMPKYEEADPWTMNRDAVAMDQLAYAYSDQDMQKRHAPLLEAEKLFEAQTLKDQQGENELMPAVQNEFMRSGLQGALSSFGSTPNTLAPGSAGEADVARNFGLNIAGFQDRNRQNRTNSLVTSESLFPRRKFGLNGGDVANIELANLAGENNWRQADHAQDVQLAQYNATGQINATNSAVQQGNVNAQAGAQSSAAQSQAIISAAQMLGKLGSTYAGAKAAATPATPNYSGWKPGPQAGTYYTP